MMSVIVAHNDGTPVMYVKGAPEVILNKCTHEQVNGVIRALKFSLTRQILLHQNAAMAADALRVLALAYQTSS